MWIKRYINTVYNNIIIIIYHRFSLILVRSDSTFLDHIADRQKPWTGEIPQLVFE